MAGDAVQNNLVLIIVPLFALLALAIMFVVIPIEQAKNGYSGNFAGMVGAGSASSGLVSMSNTLASFSPIYGIGLAIGLLVMFFGLAAWLNLRLKYAVPYCGQIVRRDGSIKCHHPFLF